MRNMRTDEAGHIVVRNLSAYWIPEIKIEREIHGTVYTITGSFEGKCYVCTDRIPQHRAGWMCRIENALRQ